MIEQTIGTSRAVVAHPEFAKHWYVGGILVAGAETAADALRMVDEAAAGADNILVTADDVRAEAARRMQAMLGARDQHHLDLILANGTREALRLLRVGTTNWSPQEAQRAAALDQADLAIEAIRAASNALEQAPPDDYVDDRHWPQF